MEAEEEYEYLYDNDSDDDSDPRTKYEELLEDDEISVEEEGFMSGWLAES